MKYMLFCIMIVIGPSKVEAQYSEINEDSNLREICRRTLSGQFLTAFHDANHAEMFVEATKSQHTDLSKKLKSEELSLKEIELKLRDTASKNRVKLADYQSQQSIVKSLRETVAEQEQLLEVSDLRAKEVRDREKKLRTALSPVFLIEFTKDPEKPQNEVFWRLQYKTPCPPYRALCPLPEKARQYLKLAALDESCNRYANQK
jgi:hypothetical protein